MASTEPPGIQPCSSTIIVARAAILKRPNVRPPARVLGGAAHSLLIFRQPVCALLLLLLLATAAEREQENLHSRIGVRSPLPFSTVSAACLPFECVCLCIVWAAHDTHQPRARVYDIRQSVASVSMVALVNDQIFLFKSFAVCRVVMHFSVFIAN